MLNNYLLNAFWGLLLSFTFALLLVGLSKYYGLKDPNILKKRAAHSRPTSRLGGVAVCLSILSVIALHNHSWHLEIAISALPIFLVGLMEDLGRPQTPMFRIAVGSFSAAIFIAIRGRFRLRLLRLYSRFSASSP